MINEVMLNTIRRRCTVQSVDVQHSSCSTPVFQLNCTALLSVTSATWQITAYTTVTHRSRYTSHTAEIPHTKETQPTSSILTGHAYNQC